MDEVGIGRLSAITGVRVPTIRFYEQIDLLPEPARTAGGQRRYQAQTVRRLTFIRHARELGFHIDDIRKLVRMADTPDAPCHSAEDLARHQLAVIDAKLRRLKAMRAELQRMIAGCPDRSAADCRIMEALSQMPANTKGARGRHQIEIT
jgi:DNA-binding transcriptional MerR regulator